MKKIISVIMLAVMTAGTVVCQAAAHKDKVNPSAIVALVEKYEGKEGFETVTFGNLAVSLVKLIANATALTPEDKAALDVMDGISKFIAVEYQGASASEKASFNKEVTALLGDAEKIVEVKDAGDSVDIYGTLSKDGEKIRDIIIHVPEESSLVCIFGTVDIKNLGAVIETTNE